MSMAAWIATNWVAIAAVAAGLGTLGGVMERSKTPWVARAGNALAGIGLDVVSIGKAMGLVKP